tara:strand:- start:7783 stop:8625 length:843 start_codon:yes stop_codon:yes gene_type:complete
MKVNDQSLNDFLGDLKKERFFSINQQEIREISEYILGISYVDLLIGSPKITLKEKELFIDLVKRRNLGEPLAYLIEKKGFWNLDLFVNSSVLVPRPETETIIEDILDSFDHSKQRVLDLGTGTGAIALSLKSERPKWEIFASDISKKAIDVATKNAKINNLNVNFFQGNWLNTINYEAIDLLISNPPYIDEEDPCLQADGILFEPKSALISKRKGLDDLFMIIDAAFFNLKEGGSIYLEHSHSQYNEVKRRLEKNDFRKIKSIKDLNGDRRITKAIKLYE